MALGNYNTSRCYGMLAWMDLLGRDGVSIRTLLVLMPLVFWYNESMFGETQKKVDPITYFAEADARGGRTKFGVKDSDRTKHVYVIGKSGMGKSTLLENMAVQDIQNGNGLCFIDPHGSAVDTFLDYIPEDRVDDVVYFAPFDFEHPIAFNVMENVDDDKRSLVAQGLLSSFKKIWGEDTFSDRMEHIVSNTLLALLEHPGSTMLSISRIFVDVPFQKQVIRSITDPVVKQFWTQEYASWSDSYRRDAYSAVLNKIGQFTSNPVIRNIVGQEKSSFDIRELMDNKKILLVNLSIGQVGESNANLLGSMLTTKIFLAGMSRADLSKPELAEAPNFYLYIDEFQNLANDSFADILSQSRKYKLNLTLAHQYIEQMPDTVRAAVFGNVGTMITFRVGATDAEIFEREFGQLFLANDFVSLGFTQIYLSLMIDGVGSSPFSARTLPPLPLPSINFREETIANSRAVYAKPRSVVEEKIANWMSESLDAPKIKPNNGMPQHIIDKKNAAKAKAAAGAESGTNSGGEKQGANKPYQKKQFEKKPAFEVTDEMKAELPGTNSFADALAGLKKETDKISEKIQKTGGRNKDNGKVSEKKTERIKKGANTEPGEDKTTQATEKKDVKNELEKNKQVTQEKNKTENESQRKEKHEDHKSNSKEGKKSQNKNKGTNKGKKQDSTNNDLKNLLGSLKDTQDKK